MLNFSAMHSAKQKARTRTRLFRRREKAHTCIPVLLSTHNNSQKHLCYVTFLIRILRHKIQHVPYKRNDTIKTSLKVSRVLITYCLDAVCLLYVFTYFVEKISGGKHTDYPGAYMIYVMLVLGGIVMYIMLMIKLFADQITWRTFFVYKVFVYKAQDLLFAVLNLVGIIVVKEELEFDLWLDQPAEHWKDIARAILTAVDLAFDPVEVIIACRCTS